jgi:7,8-dihydropterin-6-yl-methyl-4-(beta-D-ribofuranosyl)aminobenzene 5'-phosphate synthase
LAEAGKLRQADGAEVLCLVDNVVDVLLTSTEVAKRPRLGGTDTPSEPARLMESGRAAMTLRAEHGFSALITSRVDGQSRSILLDTGMSVGGLIHNMDALRVGVEAIQAVVLSHGHSDHTIGLNGLVDRLEGRRLPLVVHPDAWLQRRLAVPGRKPFEIALTSRQAVAAAFDIVERREPSYLLDDTVLVTGEVERTTDFERGFPNHEARRDGECVPDPLIFDDQAVVVNVKGKGLVIVTGCGHAGVVNTVRYACKLTGTGRVYAVIGGFHLNGAPFEPIIPTTIAALKEMAPQVIVPTHCTGWKAIHAFAAAMPDAFVQNGVGTRYVF